jgi:hypothetical protein
VLGGECRGGREVERYEYAQGGNSHVIAGAYLIVNEVKESKGVAELSMRLISESGDDTWCFGNGTIVPRGVEIAPSS